MEEIFDLEIYPEICCEICDSIIHNHIKCPVCLLEYAGSNHYGEIEDSDTTIECEECGSEFERIDNFWIFWEPNKVRLLKKGGLLK